MTHDQWLVRFKYYYNTYLVKFYKVFFHLEMTFVER